VADIASNPNFFPFPVFQGILSVKSAKASQLLGKAFPFGQLWSLPCLFSWENNQFWVDCPQFGTGLLHYSQIFSFLIHLSGGLDFSSTNFQKRAELGGLVPLLLLRRKLCSRHSLLFSMYSCQANPNFFWPDAVVVSVALVLAGTCGAFAVSFVGISLLRESGSSSVFEAPLICDFLKVLPVSKGRDGSSSASSFLKSIGSSKGAHSAAAGVEA
jgi:hypothetical protein